MDAPPSQAQPPDPRHVAIVMDGNGRWARQRGLPRTEGHRAGVENVRRVLRASRELNIPYLTLYAFSAENWNRPREEVSFLMGLLRGFLEQQRQELVREQVRFRIAGDPTPLPREVRAELDETIARTASFPSCTLTLALNYGSRQEILAATRRLLHAARAGRLDPDALTWDTLNAELFTAGLPDPDLVIRTSGEYRLSNFLLLQSAYAEFVFSPLFWPDFSEEPFRAAVQEYRRRERRFGQTGDQVRPARQGASAFSL